MSLAERGAALVVSQLPLCGALGLPRGPQDWSHSVALWRERSPLCQRDDVGYLWIRGLQAATLLHPFCQPNVGFPWSGLPGCSIESCVRWSCVSESRIPRLELPNDCWAVPGLPKLGLGSAGFLLVRRLIAGYRKGEWVAR